jgi:hypothetical protein
MKQPNRPPDSVTDFYCKIWFDEMLCSTGTLEAFNITKEDNTFYIEIYGEKMGLSEYHPEIKQIFCNYKKWLINKELKKRLK